MELLSYTDYKKRIVAIAKKHIWLDGTKVDNGIYPNLDKSASRMYPLYQHGFDESRLDKEESLDIRELPCYELDWTIADSKFAKRWIVLPDLKTYLEKRVVPDYLINGEGSSSFNVLVNSLIIPEVVEKFGMPSAKYFVVKSFPDEPEADYGYGLISPNFVDIESGEELIEGTDIVLSKKYTPKSRNMIEGIKEGLHLRKFNKEDIDQIEVDALKQIFIGRFIDNKDEMNRNFSIIVNGKRARISPMYDFDFCAGNELRFRRNRERVLDNGSSNVGDFAFEFRKYPWFEDWVRTSLDQINIKEIFQEVSLRGGYYFQDTTIRRYEDFFERQKEQVLEGLSRQKEEKVKQKKRNKFLDFFTR